MMIKRTNGTIKQLMKFASDKGKADRNEAVISLLILIDVKMRIFFNINLFCFCYDISDRYRPNRYSFCMLFFNNTYCLGGNKMPKATCLDSVGLTGLKKGDYYCNFIMLLIIRDIITRKSELIFYFTILINNILAPAKECGNQYRPDNTANFFPDIFTNYSIILEFGSDFYMWTISKRTCNNIIDVISLCNINYRRQILANFDILNY